MGRHTLTVTLLFASSITLRAQELPSAPQPAVVKPQSGESTQQLAVFHGRPYVRPTKMEPFGDYPRGSYGIPDIARSVVRSLYEQARDKRDGLGQDWTGNGQRFRQNGAINNGATRYATGKQFRMSCKLSF